MRKTRHDYDEPDSFGRIEEAALAYADADAEDDGAFRRAKERLRQAANAYGRRKFDRMKAIFARRTVRTDPRQVALFGNVSQEACQANRKSSAE